VGVDVATELPGVALEELCESRLGDELGGVGAHDVRAEELSRLGVGDDVDETACLAVDLRPADRLKRKFSDFHLVSFFSRLHLGQTY